MQIPPKSKTQIEIVVASAGTMSQLTGYAGGFNGSTQHQREIYLQDFEGLNPFATVDSKERKPCLGLIEYSPGQRFFAKELWAQSIKEVLRRPFEPARLSGSSLSVAKNLPPSSFLLQLRIPIHDNSDRGRFRVSSAGDQESLAVAGNIKRQSPNRQPSRSSEQHGTTF